LAGGVEESGAEKVGDAENVSEAGEAEEVGDIHRIYTHVRTCSSSKSNFLLILIWKQG
jgi:hypothetical protein